MHRSPAPRDAAARRSRAVVVGGAAVGIAALGHAVGGGGWPSGHLVAPALLAGAVAGAALSHVAWTAVRLLAGLVAVQLAVHVMLWIGSASPAVDPRLASLATGHGDPQAHAHLMTTLTPHMLAGHAVAISLTVAVLLSAERAALLLAHLARRFAPRRAPVDVPHRLPRGISAAERAVVVPRQLHLVTVRGHAPPASALVLT